MIGRSFCLCFGAFTLGALFSCDSADPPTEIVVVLDGDMALDRVRIQVFDHDGKDKKASRTQDFRLSRTPSAGQHTLPLSFSLVPEEADSAPSFRLVVTGYEGSQQMIEQQVGSTFQRGKSLRLDVFLMSWCEGVTCDRPTNGWLGNFTCGLASGTCEPLLDNRKLPAADRYDALAGYNLKLPPAPARPAPRDPGRPDDEVCSMCTEDYPCVKFGPTDYTCQGQFADWPMPDPTPGAKFSPDYEFVDGVVIDQVTGLLWQREVPRYPDNCTKMNVFPGDSCSFLEAKAYCERLDLANQRWRMPSMIEMQSIFDPTQPETFIDPDAFPNSAPGAYWSTSPIAENASNRWWLFSFGETAGSGDGAKVRCVSGAPEVTGSPAIRYGVEITASYNIGIDLRTELVWDREQHDDIYDWEEAKSHCASKGEDWRLPTLNELASLVDDSRSHPAIDVTMFGNTPSEGFWSSSPVPDDTREGGFAIDFDQGHRMRVPVNERLLVRCVR